MKLSPLARILLRRLQQEPDRVIYDTTPLGGMFRPPELVALDAAYEELHREGLVEPADVYFAFFGTPKTLYRITERGKEFAMAPT
jgi:hypothetical protein